MKTAWIRVYGIPTGYDVPKPDQVKLDHVFVVSELGNNWNCFGRGKESIPDPTSLLVLETSGYGDWAANIYDTTNEGRLGREPNAFSAMGVWELRNGVCQNVANRILLFALENADVRTAAANEIVTLLYGKFGFEVDVLRGRIGEVAKTIEVSDVLLESVLKRLDDGLRPEAELDVLISVLEKKTANILGAKRDELIKALSPCYAEYQSERQSVYESVSGRIQKLDIRHEFVNQLLPALKKLTVLSIPVLKEYGVSERLIGVEPEQVWGYIERLTGARV